MKSPKVLYHVLSIALVLLSLPINSVAQSKSAAGNGADVSQRVISNCDIHFRNSRLEISALTKRVIKLLDCNAKGMTLDPDTGNCINLPAGPAHSWSGTVLKFVDAYGNLTEGQDLKGPQGDPGTNVQCYPVADGGASSSSGASSSGASSGGDSSSGSSSSSSGGDDSSSSGASSTSSSSSGADSTTSSGSSSGMNAPCMAQTYWWGAGCEVNVPKLTHGQSKIMSYDWCPYGSGGTWGNVTLTCNNGTLSPSGAICRSQNCFVKGTYVLMADGSSKPIETLKVGDKVRGRSGINTVIGTPNYDSETPVYGFNGGKPFVTGGHPFWTQDGWKAIDPSLTPTERHNVQTTQLQVGDVLTLDSGEAFVVRSIDKAKTAAVNHVFNPQLDGDHTYYANGLLVHNKRFCGHNQNCRCKERDARCTEGGGLGCACTGIKYVPQCPYDDLNPMPW